MLQEQMRPAIWVLFIMLCGMLWFRWVAANNPVAEQNVEQVEKDSSGAKVPALSSVEPTVPSSLPAVDNQKDASIKIVSVKTDVIDLTISMLGGQVDSLDLLTYKQKVDVDEPFALLSDEKGNVHTLQSGLIGNGVDTSKLIFSADKEGYQLKDDTLIVTLLASDADYLFKKVYTFKRGEFDFSIRHTVENEGEQVWKGFQFRQITRSPVESQMGIGKIYTYTGGVISSEESNYEKIGFDDMASENLNRKVKDGWIAMIQHYFLSAVVPENGEKNLFYSLSSNNGDVSLGMSSGSKTVKSGESGVFNTTFYVGPKITKDLASLAPNLDKTVDFGYFYFISELLFKLLALVQSFIGNWGWAIVVVTVIIKLIFFPLSAYSYKSMAKMRKFQPEMERMRKQFSDDRQKLGQETMKLYKKEKINPASGCLPMLLQIPVFLAFYFMLMEAVELRQAPWAFWIEDLSVRDPYFVLPIINAALMFTQQKLNPPPADPLQKKIMTYMPLVFGFMFMFFPAGLVLYWSVSNSFSIIQQRVINKRYGVKDSPAT